MSQPLIAKLVKAAMLVVTDARGDVWEFLRKVDQIRWRRRAVNGKVVGSSSESYSNRDDCWQNAVRNGLRVGRRAHVYSGTVHIFYASSRWRASIESEDRRAVLSSWVAGSLNGILSLVDAALSDHLLRCDLPNRPWLNAAWPLVK